MTGLRQLLRDAWAITRPYWFSEDRWSARGLLLVVIALTLGIVYINVLLNHWNNTFYNALQNKDYDVFIHQLIRFSWLAGLYIVVAVYQLYLTQMLQIRWRRWLTEYYLRAWLSDGAYYRMQLVAGETDNPDQRIAEDVRLLISGTLDLAIGGLRAVVTLISFVAILWGLSGPLTIPLGSTSITLPGYMIWAALLYAIVGTWLTNWVGRPLVRLNFDQQRYEADFRFGLVRFRENTEGVALYRGEPDELRGFRERFGAVVQNWWDIMRQQKRLTGLTAGYAQAAVIFPFIVAAPRYFRGEILLGGLVQTATAFGQVQHALSFIVSSYTDIAAWRAVVERLAGFEHALSRVRIEAATQDGIRRADGEAAAPGCGGRRARPPQRSAARRERQPFAGARRHRPPVGAFWLGQEHARPCHRRDLALWARRDPVPHDARVLFLPQKPYLPIGTLREVVSYPMPAGGVDDATLREVLEAVGLPELAWRLDESSHWALQLSPGEQQRIAFARALVQKPDWLFLDEATSAVDEATEARLYQLMRERLVGTTVFSVGHRGTLRPFHTRQLVLQPNGGGPASIVEVVAASAPAQ